jgi:hypothetical protein
MTRPRKANEELGIAAEDWPTRAEWYEAKLRHRLMDEGMTLEEAELYILDKAQARDIALGQMQEPQKIGGGPTLSLQYPLWDDGRGHQLTLEDLL